MENELSKRIESLEKELKQLKKELAESKKDNLAMFGRTYSQVGDIKSDLVLNTRGQVKIRIGGKFIDLLKNGEINVDTDIIFTTSDSDNLGSKNGLYILDDGSVYLKYKDKQINLVGELGTTYVSFKDTQETTSDEKLQALHNIGFYCESLESLGETSIQNGLVFIEADQSLYVVKDGIGTKFISVIQETVNSILEEKEQSEAESETETALPFKINNNRIVFDYGLLINQANSINAVKNQEGFYLYKNGENYVLEIDELIVHTENPYKQHIDPDNWDKDCNFITDSSYQIDDYQEDSDEWTITDLEEVKIQIELLFPNKYSENDKLTVFSFYKETEDTLSDIIQLQLTIESITDEGIFVTCDLSMLSDENSEIVKTRVLEVVENLKNRMVRKSKSVELEVDPFQNLIVLCNPDSIPDGWSKCNELPELKDDSDNILAIYIKKNV